MIETNRGHWPRNRSHESHRDLDSDLIDGVSKGTISANIPTVNLTALTAASGGNVETDFIFVEQDRSARRRFRRLEPSQSDADGRM